MATPSPPDAPTAAEAAFAEAWTLTTAGRHAEAEASYRRALELAPRHPAAWSNLGDTLAALGRPQDAEPCYRRALALDPADSGALRNLGLLLRAQGRFDDLRMLAKADRADVAIVAALSLPAIATSRADIEAQRATYAEGLRRLAAGAEPLAYDGEAFPLPSFQLAYHGLDDRPLMEATAEVFRARIPNLNYQSPNAMRTDAGAGGRIRLAVISDHLFNHTIGHLYRGIIGRLDRGRFEVSVAHGASARRDAFRASIDAAADRSITLTGGLAEQHAQIEALAPDIIFYPDIGMSAPSYALAFARLAPVQATAWGHPDTTGLSTPDAFISTGMFEPPDAERYYTERLIRLSRIPCCFDPPPRPETIASREDLGLPAQGVLYGCPQTLFKLHPDFDAILATIARGDPNGRIVLPISDPPAWMDALKARWRDTHPILLERVHWTPRIAPEAFLQQLGHIDVMLDPLHFGGGYTFYQAMIQGVPTVTRPGEFARGRVVAGAYRQMGVGEELVARSYADYVTLALRLGADPARRVALREELRAAAHEHLFSDVSAVRQLEDAFAELLAAARGEGPAT